MPLFLVIAAIFLQCSFLCPALFGLAWLLPFGTFFFSKKHKSNREGRMLFRARNNHLGSRVNDGRAAHPFFHGSDFREPFLKIKLVPSLKNPSCMHAQRARPNCNTRPITNRKRVSTFFVFRIGRDTVAFQSPILLSGSLFSPHLIA